MLQRSEDVLKLKSDDLEIQYEILPLYPNDKRRAEIRNEIDSIDEKLSAMQRRVDELNVDIDRLTNHADGLDYAVSAISGVITGLIDSFFVGETEININSIEKVLVKTYHVANDSAYRHKKNDGHWISSAMYHRLDDLAHHPTLLGFAASILVRYFRLVIFIDGSDGKPHIFFGDRPMNAATCKLEREQLLKAWAGIIFGGLCVWLANVSESKLEETYEGNLPGPLKKLIRTIGKAPIVIEILKAADSWIGHMMSDVSTSQGIPNVFLSFLKEISVLPILRNTDFRVTVDDMYRKGKFNLSEWGGVIFSALKKQTLPVLINDVLVRGFYFVRRLIGQYKVYENLKNINWESVIPFNNRTITRMLTISTGTFMATDMIDAAIRGAAKSGGNGAVFAKEFILRVNFVGVGRFAVAVGTDIGMGIKRVRRESERRALYSDMISLTNAKMFYSEADMWISVKEAGKATEEAYIATEKFAKEFVEYFGEVTEASNSITEDDANSFRDKNSELTSELLDILDF